MVALDPSFLTDDTDLEADLAATNRVLTNLRGFAAAGAWNWQQLEKLESQIAATEAHLALQRANLEAAS